MTIKKIKLTFLMLPLFALLSAGQVMAASTTANTQATASLAAECQISAQNVNFGQINPQIAAGGVNASSNMTVTCTKGSAYSIGLAYGGVYGGTTNSSSAIAYYVPVSTNGSGYHIYDEYNSSGTYLGQYGSLNAPPNTSTNNDGATWVVNTTVYGYGVMTGVLSGDTIGYSIAVPGKSSQVWNTGNYTYAATGTGTSQSIPISATAQTGTHGPAYPTPDTYTDTVTATISY
jgi:spore coat protein U-like protein